MTGARGDAARRPQQRLKGALILTLAVFVTGLQDAFIKDLSSAYPVHEMQTFRAGAALTLIFGWIVASGGLRLLLATRPSGLLLLRSAILSLAAGFVGGVIVWLVWRYDILNLARREP